MLAIDRLKRIISNAKRLSSADHSRSTEMLEPPLPPNPSRWSAEMGNPPAHYQGQDVMITTKTKRSPSGDSLSTSGSSTGGGEFSTFHQHHRDDEMSRSDIVHMRQRTQPPAAAMFQPDLVAIHVKRNLSRSGTNEHLSDSDPSQIYQQTSFQPMDHRNADHMTDGEMTPTNERGHTPSDEVDSGSLRRPSAMVSPSRFSVKPKPVAKIVAKTKRASREVPSDIIVLPEKGDNYGTLGKSKPYAIKEHIYDNPAEVVSNTTTFSQQTPSPHDSPRSSVMNTPQSPSGRNYSTPPRVKKLPPPPPKRTNSIKHDNPPVVEVRTAAPVAPPVAPPMVPQVAPPTPPPPPPVKAVPPAPKLQTQRAYTPTKAASSPKPSSPSSAKSNETAPPPPPAATAAPAESLMANLAQELKSGNLKAGLRRRSNTGGSSDGELPAPPTPTDSTYTPPQSEDFPPPPPPISVASPAAPPMKPKTFPKVSKPPPTTTPMENKTISSLSGRSETTIENGMGTIRRREGSVESNASTGSTDTNTLPFANENVGTIKQRNPSSKPSIVSVSNGEEEDGEKQLDVDSSFFEDTGTVRRVKPQPQPQQQQQQQASSHAAAAAGSPAKGTSIRYRYCHHTIPNTAIVWRKLLCPKS